MVVNIIDIAIDIQLNQAQLAEAIKVFDEQKIREIKSVLYDLLEDMEGTVKRIRSDIN